MRFPKSLPFRNNKGNCAKGREKKRRNRGEIFLKVKKHYKGARRARGKTGERKRKDSLSMVTSGSAGPSTAMESSSVRR